MSTLLAPDLLTQGRWWSGEELDAIAKGWLAAVRERARGDGLIAVAVPTSPEGVALVIALSTLPSPVILLSPDVRAWRSAPTIPIGTPLVLPPTLAQLAPEAEKHGLIPTVLPDASTSATGPPVDAFSGAGIVQFTSGSTGLPRPVFHPAVTYLSGTRARIQAMGLASGAGIVMSASPVYGQGLRYLVSAILLQGPLALLHPHDHRSALITLAQPVFGCWRATRHLVEALCTCSLTSEAIVPPMCVVGTPMPPAVWDAFLRRFGVPLRQGYSSTETGPIALDASPPEDVQPDSVGRPLDSVEIRIGDHPDSSPEPDQPGQIWVRAPWQMAGYGFPPRVERPGDVDGWWPTKDLGRLRFDGYLSLVGRIDDAIRTRDNRTVNLAHVAATLCRLDGVSDAVVVAVETTAGQSFGAVVECAAGTTEAALRAALADVLPPWSWPRTIEPVSALPRLANGKPDRQACARLLAATAPD